jgi:hypothetical protein
VASDRQDQGEGETMTMALQYVYRLNKLWGLDALNLNYFLISGLAASRSYYGWSNEKMDVWNEIVNPNYIFFDNHMKDPRHWDCTLVGQLHDVGIYDVMQKFSEGSKEKAERIRQLYGGFDRERTQNYADSLTDWRYRHHNINFFLPDAKNQNLCRVIEIWRKESKERYRVHDTLSGDFYKVDIKDRQQIDLENQVRIQEQTAAGVLPEDIKLIHYEWFVDNYWYYYFLTPKGDVLKEGETEYWHESHPFTFKIFNFYDGNVFPFVGDIIDQQHYINRIIMLQDFLYRASAKGVLAIPEECIPDDKNVEDFAEEWAKFNGVFVYKAKAGVPPPHQIVSNATQLGLTDMLQIQLKLLEDISGVHGALQGVTPNSGTPAALYAQQVQNSSTSLTEIFEAFKEFREERDMKNLKLIQQYYDQPRLINVSGNGSHSSYPLQFFDSVFGKAKEISLT